MERVLIGIPVYDHIEKRVQNAIDNLPKELGGYEFHLEKVYMANLPEKRNYLMRKAKEMGVDWAWMLDGDTVPTAKHFLDLKEPASIYGVISGTYKNNTSGEYEGGYWVKGKPGVVDRFITDLDGRIIDVDFFPGGCTLMTKGFLNTFKGPGFYQPIRENRVLGEDQGFCLNLLKQKFPIKLHTGVILEHIPRYKDNMEDKVKEVIKKHLIEIKAVRRENELILAPHIKVIQALCEVHSITQEEIEALEKQ